jgi:hypothetical protein
MPQAKTVAMTEVEYRMYRDEYAGICTTCMDVTADSGVEPDACGYECPACECPTLYGVEEALMMGLVEIVNF